MIDDEDVLTATMSSESESNESESVFNTVQKFEASKIIIKGPPLGPPPPVPTKPKNKINAQLAESEDLTETDDDTSSLQLQSLSLEDIKVKGNDKDKDKKNDTTITDQVKSKSQSPSPSPRPSPKPSPKQKPISVSLPKKSIWGKTKTTKLGETSVVSNITSSDPAIANLSQLPKKSSMKKTRSLPKMEVQRPLKKKGIWYKMEEQYPVENFSGRQAIFDQIQTVVFGQKGWDARPISRAIVLAGKQGMGKTQIARKFIFKFFMDCKGDANVVWINASNKESIVNTILYLHSELYPKLEGPLMIPAVSHSRLNLNKIKKPRDSVSEEEEIQNAQNDKIRTILTNPIFSDNPTIFVFDNATNEEQIIEYLPQLAPFGHIPSVIVTSRNENWNNSRVIKVGEFEFNEAVDFLTETFKHIPEFTRFQAEDLAKELHRYPPLLQRAKAIVFSYLHTGNAERALLRLEKNVGLVRRLKNEEILKTKELEIAVLSVDRGHFYEEDAYIREFDGELRSHSIAMQLYQLDAILSNIAFREHLSILAVNEDAYILTVLANLIGSRSEVLGLYDSETSTEFTVDHLTNCLEADNPQLHREKIRVRLVEVPKAKPSKTAIPPPTKQSNIVPVLDKWKATEGKHEMYDLIITNIYSGQDLKSIKQLLHKGGRFITSMSSSDTGLLLKKINPKKLEMKILKQDFPELLVVIRKLV